MLDDIIEESNAYKMRGTLRKRTDPNVDSSTPNITFTKDTQTTSVVVSGKNSIWPKKIREFISNNWLTNKLVQYKIVYDESDNLVIRSVRTLTDQVGDSFKSNTEQNGMKEVHYILELYRIREISTPAGF